MKNIIELVERADIHDFVQGLWKTETFRDSHVNNGFIGEIVEQFAYLPRLFAEATNDHLERSHFSTWWNVMMIRDDYTNPFIHDLYWLHEMYHAACMPYVPGIGKAAFDEKMQRNELEASVLSEIQVYFELPGLRAVSFDHPIYADRFLTDSTLRALWQTNPQVAIETIRTIRRDVMVSKAEHLMDITELWVRRFAEQNAVHSITWADRYLEVEAHMANFQRAAATDRKLASALHREWIEIEMMRDPIDAIPFRQEAELFAPHYWANKERYSRAMAETSKSHAAA